MRAARLDPGSHAPHVGRRREVDGWTVHPYGSLNTDATRDCVGPHGYGWPDAARLAPIAVNSGSSAPWYVSEVGQCVSAGSACPTVVDPATQAADMTRYLDDAAEVSVGWCSSTGTPSCDDGAGGYGLLGGELRPRLWCARSRRSTRLPSTRWPSGSPPTAKVRMLPAATTIKTAAPLGAAVSCGGLSVRATSHAII